jgi:hypothetical protein
MLKQIDTFMIPTKRPPLEKISRQEWTQIRKKLTRFLESNPKASEGAGCCGRYFGRVFYDSLKTKGTYGDSVRVKVRFSPSMPYNEIWEFSESLHRVHGEKLHIFLPKEGAFHPDLKIIYRRDTKWQRKVDARRNQ